jgi:TonB family protein
MKNFIQQNMKYPASAAKAGIAGTVYVAMVVNKDGALSDVKIQRGVEASIDAEAMRVIQALPPWKPGKQNGKTVRVRYILPVKFDPNNNSDPVPASGISPVNDKMDITTRSVALNDGTMVEGNVKSVNDNEALAGVNVIVRGTTTGTSTDTKGNFRIKMPNDKKELVFSFIGFETKKVSL